MLIQTYSNESLHNNSNRKLNDTQATPSNAITTPFTYTCVILSVNAYDYETLFQRFITPGLFIKYAGYRALFSGIGRGMWRYKEVAWTVLHFFKNFTRYPCIAISSPFNRNHFAIIPPIIRHISANPNVICTNYFRLWLIYGDLTTLSQSYPHVIHNLLTNAVTTPFFRHCTYHMYANITWNIAHDSGNLRYNWHLFTLRNMPVPTAYPIRHCPNKKT